MNGPYWISDRLRSSQGSLVELVELVLLELLIFCGLWWGLLDWISRDR